jgi:hypothetical protein
LVRRTPRAGRQELKVRYGRRGGPLTYRKATIETDGPSLRRVLLEPIGKVDAYVVDDLRANRGSPITITFKLIPGKAVRLAFLSWGFLALFARFGYSYALSRAARTVRTSITAGTASLGGACVLMGEELPVRFEEAVVGLIAVQVGAPGAGPRISWPGLGVTIQGAVDVCLPLAADPSGNRIRSLEEAVDDEGILQLPFAIIPFEEFFEQTRGRTYLGLACSLAFGNGSVLTLVGTEPLEAEESLASPTPPLSTRARLSF